MRKPKIAVVGGGTGTFVALTGLVKKEVDLVTILTMADDGGSNRILRDEFGLLPTSGLRQAVVAMSQNPTLLRELFMYRFHQGNGIAGMTFGNLFMAALADITGSQKKAIEETCKLLQVKGRILPISYNDVRLVAWYEGGLRVMGEHKIDEPAHDGRLRIVKLTTRPKAVIDRKARQAIMMADLVVLGPGDFYTNTVANLVVKGMVGALKKSKSKIIFVVNLMTKYGEAFDYKASDYLRDLDCYLPLEHIDGVLLNSNRRFPKKALELYHEEQAVPVEDDLDDSGEFKFLKIVREDLLSEKIYGRQKGDVLGRSMIRHHPDKLAGALLRFV